MNDKSKDKEPVLFSYKTLRRTVGILGIILPFLLALGAKICCNSGLKSSVSAYYHTPMGDVFVGILFVIGIFLFAYKGYEGDRDNLVGNLSCLFALGVALFPTAPDVREPPISEFTKWIGVIHFIFAALLFAMLIYFSLCLFTKTSENSVPKGMKSFRNRVYRVCGYAMLISILLIAIVKTFDLVAQLNPVFWLETIAMVAFGISWFVKGEAVFKDKPAPSSSLELEHVLE